MIDHAARKQMADIIGSYLNEKIKAFQFSDALDEVASQTEDRTVRVITDHLWYFYDDLKNHKVVATRAAWDYVHRLLLVLESDGEVEIDKSRKWSPRQLVAACALLAFAVLAPWIGWGPRLLVLSVPFGLVSMLLSLWCFMSTPRPEPVELALTPFSSVSELIKVRRRTPRFLKKRYPNHLKKRRIRHPIVDVFMSVWSALGWSVVYLMLAPVVLIFQAMPETESRMRVRTPQQCQEARP